MTAIRWAVTVWKQDFQCWGFKEEGGRGELKEAIKIHKDASATFRPIGIRAALTPRAAGVSALEER